MEVCVGRKDFEEQREDGGDLGEERFEVGLCSEIPGLCKLRKENSILCIFGLFLLSVKVFAEDGAFAGQVMFFGRVQDGIKELFQEMEPYDS